MTVSFSKLCAALLLLSLLSMSSLFAQSADIQWGESLKSDNFILRTLGQTKDGVYALAIQRKELFVEYYEGEKLTQKFSKKIVMPDIKGVKTRMSKMLFLEGKLSVIASSYNRKAKTFSVYGFHIDNNGKMNPKPVNILSVTVEKGSRRGEFHIKTSRDNSKILIYHQAYYKGADENVASIRILTSDLTVLKEVTNKSDDWIMDGYIKNNGAVYVAVGGEDEALRVLQYEPGNGFEKVDIAVDFPNLEISSLSFTDDAQGNVIAAGFYGRKIKGYIRLEGTFFFKIDYIKAKTGVTQTSSFGAEVAAAMLKEKKANKGNLVPNFFRPKRIIAKADGGAVMIGEYHHEYEGSSGAITTTYGPIIVVDIAADGKVNWTQTIVKKQVSTIAVGGMGILGFFFIGEINWLLMTKDPAIYHSFVMAMKGDKMYFIYNDNPKNVEIKHFRDTKALVAKKSPVPVLVTIDATGKMKKELYKGGKEEVILIPFASSQKSYKSVIIHGSRKKEKKFGRLILK